MPQPSPTKVSNHPPSPASPPGSPEALFPTGAQSRDPDYTPPWPRRCHAWHRVNTRFHHIWARALGLDIH